MSGFKPIHAFISCGADGWNSLQKTAVSLNQNQEKCPHHVCSNLLTPGTSCRTGLFKFHFDENYVFNFFLWLFFPIMEDIHKEIHLKIAFRIICESGADGKMRFEKKWA